MLSNFFKAQFCYLLSYLESQINTLSLWKLKRTHVANIASILKKTTGVNLKKALTLAFHYCRKNVEIIILA